VTPLSVVEDLQVLKDRVGQLDTGSPASPVEQLDLQPRPERLHHGVVVAVADRAHRGTSPASLTRWVNPQEANCPPWSEWTIAPAAGVRVSMAMPSVLVTSAAVGDASIDQPTTRRENTSSTTAQETLPS
jgi:hypothetical protein